MLALPSVAPHPRGDRQSGRARRTASLSARAGAYLRVKLRLAGDRGACLQARAEICAEGLRDYARLFDTGPTDAAGLVALAGSLGLEQATFASCLRSPETVQVRYRDVNEALAKDVRGTPAVFMRALPLLRRVEALERQNRRLKALGATALLGTSVGLLLAADLFVAVWQPRERRPAARMIDATGIVLREPNGRVQATLFPGRAGIPELRLFDTDGMPPRTLDIGGLHLVERSDK